ncbi:MAG: Holliday junction resolvase RuvX [Bacteroidales bacterium]|nr:Holliday junction resolvase RuvX [Bacteroidales bacterium]
MDRIIGIDYGSARTGLAVSDPLQIFASALETLPSAKIIDYLVKYSASERITLFVVGWPLNLNGEPAQTAPEVQAFIANLKKAFPDVPVELEDERFTSVLAHRAMIDGGMKASRRRDKKEVDKISAAIILQSYLDRKK